MHRFSCPADPDHPLPHIEDFRFNDALDVIDDACLEGMFHWRTWSEVWHLDDRGTFCCYAKLSSFSGIRDYAKDPWPFYETRRTGLADGGCGTRWLINEPRLTRMGRKPPDEGDVRSFQQLRRIVADIGVDLVDCMLWSDEFRCWSLHELTSGTTRWRRRPRRSRRRSRMRIAQQFETLLHPLCTVGDMEEFTPLGAEMARLAGRLGTLAPAVCDRRQLEWIVASGRRLEAFAAAQVALATVQLERLLREEYAEGLRDRSGEAAEADTAGGSAADAAGAGSSDATTADGDATTSAGGAASVGADAAGASAGGAASAGADRGGDTNPPGNGGPSMAGETSTADGDTPATNDAADGTRGGPGGRRESAEELGRQIRRGKWLRRCELFAAALQAGTITPEHIDTLAVVLEHVEPHVLADVLADEERLVEVARRMARSAFARYLRDVIDRVRADGGMSRFERQLKDSFASFKADDDTQMYRLFCEIDPVRGAEMFQAVQRRVDEMYQTRGATDGLSRNQVVLAALHGLICREPTAATADDSDDDDVGRGPEIIVICDCQSLVAGAHEHTVCETYDGIRLPVSFVRDLCAEAMLTVAIAGADGQILKVGMAERLANRAQRRALRAKYRHCAHPDCTVPFAACRIHHVVPWERQGPTDLANLLPLCFKHHHLVHEGGWRLTIDPDRTLHWYRPGGALFATTPFVPLLKPKTQRSATTRGSPSGSPSGPSPPASSDAPPGATSITAADDLRLFDPSAA